MVSALSAGNRAREDRFDASGEAPDDTTAVAQPGEESEGESDDAQRAANPATKELTPDERRMVAELQLRDREVRSHEAAHKAAGGGHVGGASYTYQQGPDGRQYAIGGEVPVDLSTSGGSPEAIIAKMEQVRAAALAPADPSPQDYAVAAAADAIAAEARRDLQQQESEESEQATTAKSEQADKPEQNAPADPFASRALDAYRQAQEAAFFQPLINQRA